MAPPADPNLRPPEQSRVWLWALGLVATACVALGGWVLWVYANHDKSDFIDSSRVLDAIEKPCANLAQVARSTPLDGTSAERAEALATVSAAARLVPAAVGRLDPDDLAADLPAASWAEDWTTLLDQVDKYRLVAGDGPMYETPETADGYSITGRMDIAAEPECGVPRILIELDPSPPPMP